MDNPFHYELTYLQDHPELHICFRHHRVGINQSLAYSHHWRIKEGGRGKRHLSPANPQVPSLCPSAVEVCMEYGWKSRNGIGMERNGTGFLGFIRNGMEWNEIFEEKLRNGTEWDGF